MGRNLPTGVAVAERVGFEPTDPRANAVAERPNQPDSGTAPGHYHGDMALPNVAVCRPVHLDPSVSIDAAILRHTTKYSDSTEDECELCGCAVWVGPRVRAALVAGFADALVCFRCVPDVAPGLSGQVFQLGNPEGDRSKFN